MRLEDAETGKVITRVVRHARPAGKLIKVSRKLFGVSGDGLKLKANHRYRVVGEYDNPDRRDPVKGAMAHMVGLFVPDDMSKWPAIDPSDPTYQRDLASLQVRGGRRPGDGSRRRTAGRRMAGWTTARCSTASAARRHPERSEGQRSWPLQLRCRVPSSLRYVATARSAARRPTARTTTGRRDRPR